MSIGQFAQATGLTVKRLRHYDSTGTLHAAQVDEASGYRYYEPAQVADALLLAALRDSGVGLREVAEVLSARANRDEHIATALYRTKSDTESARDRIARTIKQLGLVPRVPIALRWIEQQHILSASADLTFDECGPWFDEVYPQLVRRAHGPTGAGGAGGASYASSFFTEGRGTVTAFLPVPANTPDAVTLVGGYFAVATHEGPYDTFRPTYAALGEYVHQHHTPDNTIPVGEHYLIGPSESSDPRDWRSEVHWAIRSEH